MSVFAPKKTIIMGGEPLLYKNLEYILDVFPNITISTNSLKIKDNIELLKKYRHKLTIQISIEGGREETNRIRGFGTKIDVWSECIKSAKILQKHNISFYFRCSYHRGNIEQIKKEVFKEAEFFDVGLMLLPRVDLPPLNSNEQTMFFREVIQHKKCAVAQPHFFQFIGKKGRCGAGDERINVFFDKRITPCNFDLDYTIGRIGDEEKKIKENMDLFVENFKIPPFECSGCYRNSICKGSCYVAKSYIGCPLRRNIELDNIIVYDKLDKNQMKKDMNVLTKYVKNLGIC